MSDEMIFEKEDPELVAHLQDISRPSFSDEESLARIRERLLEASAPDVILSTRQESYSRENAVLVFPTKRQGKQKGWGRRLNTLAAVLVTVMLVGSLIGTFSFLRGSRTGSRGVNAPGTAHNTPGANTTNSSTFLPSNHLPVPSDTVFMADAKTAWVQTITPLPGEGDVAGPLVRTTDGGKTWQDVTPPQSGFDAGEQLYPIDAMTVWLTTGAATSATGSPFSSLFRTVDGGASWQEFALPANNGHFRTISIMFSSRDLGWITEAVQENGQTVGVSFLTTDGAQTWRKLTDLPIGSIPSNQVPQISMQFTDDQIGWASIGSPAGSQLYITRDSGRSWSKESLPTALNASGTPGSQSEDVSVHFFNQRDGYLMAQNNTGQNTSITFYSTHDGGQTWQSSSTLDEGNGYIASPFHFLSEQQIQLTTTSSVFIYTLEQNHWTATSAYPISQGTILASSFSDGSTGLIAANYSSNQVMSSGDNVYLLKTTDGGASWTTLNFLPTKSTLTPATMGYLTSAGWTYFTAHEGFGPENFSTSLQTGSSNADPAKLPHLVVRKWLVRFMCVGDHTVSMELNGTQHFSVTNCDQQPTSTVVTFASPQEVSTLKVHSSKAGHWLAVFLACTNEKLC